MACGAWAWAGPSGHVGGLLGQAKSTRGAAMRGDRQTHRSEMRRDRYARFPFCRPHGGLLGAASAEAERFRRPVIILRNPRKAALGKLGATEDWPEGLPKRPDLLAVGPLARGRLFEAHANRHTAPDVWKHELRFRVRDKR